MSGYHSGVVEKIHGLSAWINAWVERSLFVMGFSMAFLTGAQVFCRYVLNHSLFWSEEVGRILLVWITFLGATAAYRRGIHVGIVLVAAKLPERWRRGTEMLAVVLSLVFFEILVIYGTLFIRFVQGQKTAALGLPQGVPYFVLPLSGVVFSIHAVSRLVGLLVRQEGGRR